MRSRFLERMKNGENQGPFSTFLYNSTFEGLKLDQPQEMVRSQFLEAQNRDGNFSIDKVISSDRQMTI